MARFCTECGKELPENITFCTECGTKLEAVEPSPTSQPAPVINQAQPAYIPPAPMQDNTNKVVGTGLYIGLMLLFALPLIGFIACIIMAFTAKNKNIKNYARATLIWMIIALVLSIILIVIVSLLTNTLVGYLNQMTDGQFGGLGDVFNQFDEIKNSVNEIGNVTNQLQNGALDGLPTN